jgi:two-component system phosphate regulon sensor histidine kinase PhoR
MEAGRKPYVMHPTQLNTVVENVIRTYRAHLEHEGFGISLSFAPTLQEFPGNEEAISEALINVLDNAVKYSPKEKRIDIRTGSANGEAFVEVQDQGIGIDRDHHVKIFEKFYRVSSALVHDTKGSGLGLSLVKHIMEAHNGKVELESSPEKGSTFRLVFPAPGTKPIA